MPRHPQKSQYKEAKHRIIFLLRSPKTKEFFVGHCLPNSLLPIFRQHWSGDRLYTDKCFLSLKKEGLHPCLTVLEEVYATPVEAYRYVIAWTKIFVDAGYISLNTGNISCYIEDLQEDALRFFEDRRDKNLEEICDCKSCLVTNYNRKACPFCTCATPIKREYPKSIDTGKTQKTKSLHIRLSEDDWDAIEKNAKVCGKTMSAYVRNVALEMCLLHIEHEYITEHTHEISSYKNAVSVLVYTIMKTQNYVPKDLEYILEKTDMILKLEKQFFAKHIAFGEGNRKLIRRTVKQVVKDLSQNEK